MEGVNSIMPLAVRTGMGVLGAAAAQAASGGGGTAGEERAEAVEAQARRQAEAEARSARDEVRGLRGEGRRKGARARVSAANSGLALSGSSLLSLEALEHDTDEAVERAMGESALRVQGVLDAGARQARSIRLSGRAAPGRDGGLGSLLRLGSQVLGGL